MGNCVIEPAMQAKQFKPIAPKPEGVKLGRKPASVKVPVEVSDFLEAMPREERILFLRRAIAEAALEEFDRRGLPLPSWADEFIQS